MKFMCVHVNEILNGFFGPMNQCTIIKDYNFGAGGDMLINQIFKFDNLQIRFYLQMLKSGERKLLKCKVQMVNPPDVA